MVRVYDRPLLRSSALGDGASKAKSDRFAMGLREPGCDHPGYVAALHLARHGTMDHLYSQHVLQRQQLFGHWCAEDEDRAYREVPS